MSPGGKDFRTVLKTYIWLKDEENGRSFTLLFFDSSVNSDVLWLIT